MAYRLPPLTALRAFEAAARELSFTRAAADLHVTQSAVSHQIKSLEAHFDKPLFHRHKRELSLTEYGEWLLPPVRRAFEILADAADQLSRQTPRRTLTLSVLPSLASRWLVGRLGKFLRANPEIDIRLQPSARLVDFERENVDVGLRYGRGLYPGLHAEYLMTEDVFPVCSPGLLEEGHGLRTPADLRHHTLLHDDDFREWATWLDAVDMRDVDPRRGPIFSDSGMVIEAALRGQGVALARGALVSEELEQGRLIKPFKFQLPSEYAYYLVYPPRRRNDPLIQSLERWLLDEARRGLPEALRL